MPQTIFGITFQTLDDPLGTRGTIINGVDGHKIVGTYLDSSDVNHGFVYDGASFQTLDVPGASSFQYGGTVAYGIDGNRIVGSYYDEFVTLHGFVYDGATFTTLDFPGANLTQALGISGSDIVGRYDNGYGSHGFLFDGSNYTALDFPGGFDSIAFGISGTHVVGVLNTSFYHQSGYSSIFGAFDPPDSTDTVAYADDANNVVGLYIDSDGNIHGFLYDGTSYVTIDDPLGIGSFPQVNAATGISGDTIVGYFSDGSMTHGYIATVPEPFSATLAAASLLGFLAVAKSIRSRS